MQISKSATCQIFTGSRRDARYSRKAWLHGEFQPFSPASETNPLKSNCRLHGFDYIGQTGLGFSARAELTPRAEKIYVIETEFQPGLKNRKQYGCR